MSTCRCSSVAVRVSRVCSLVYGHGSCLVRAGMIFPPASTNPIMIFPCAAIRSRKAAGAVFFGFAGVLSAGRIPGLIRGRGLQKLLLRPRTVFSVVAAEQMSALRAKDDGKKQNDFLAQSNSCRPAPDRPGMLGPGAGRGKAVDGFHPQGEMRNFRIRLRVISREGGESIPLFHMDGNNRFLSWRQFLFFKKPQAERVGRFVFLFPGRHIEAQGFKINPPGAVFLRSRFLKSVSLM